MKLLLLALFCFPIFAQDFEKAKLSDFSQEVVVDAQLKKLESLNIAYEVGDDCKILKEKLNPLFNF